MINLFNKNKFLFSYLGIVLISVGLFYQTFYSMFMIWVNSKTYQYGLLVFPISVYLVWREREAVSKLRYNINYAYLLGIILTISLWLVGRATEIQILQHLSVVLFILVLLLLAFGIDVFKKLAFPLLFILFSVPFGEEIVPALQAITHFGVVLLLKLFAFPVEVEGLYIFVKSHVFEVTRDCSGIRYTMVTIIFSSVYSYLTKLTKIESTLFITISILFPILLNILRALFIVFIAVFGSHEMALGFDHTVYGLVFFIFNILILLAIGIPIARKIASII